MHRMSQRWGRGGDVRCASFFRASASARSTPEPRASSASAASLCHWCCSGCAGRPAGAPPSMARGRGVAPSRRAGCAGEAVVMMGVPRDNDLCSPEGSSSTVKEASAAG